MDFQVLEEKLEKYKEESMVLGFSQTITCFQLSWKMVSILFSLGDGNWWKILHYGMASLTLDIWISGKWALRDGLKCRETEGGKIWSSFLCSITQDCHMGLQRMTISSRTVTAA